MKKSDYLCVDIGIKYTNLSLTENRTKDYGAEKSYAQR